MAAKKQVFENFLRLDAKAAKKIRDVNKDSRIIAARQELAAREEKLAGIINQIENYTTLTRSGAIRAEAQQRLNGKPAQKSPTKEELVQERNVQKEEIQLTREKNLELERNITAQYCEQIRDIVEDYAARTLDAFSELHEALENENMLFLYLRRLGYRQDHRPACWRLTFGEEKLINTGVWPFGRLSNYIAERRKAWGIDE